MKSKRVKFRQEAEVPVIKELERVHADTTGPFAKTMLSGAKYMFLFVDAKKQECGKHMQWVYFTEHKDEITGYYTMRQFILEREREQGSLAGMTLRTDNGTEYKNTSVKDFLLKKRIKTEYSTPESPQENGMVECHIRYKLL